MGLLSFFKKNGNSVSKEVAWLQECDRAYTRAFEVKNAAGLDKYFTRSCLIPLMERIRLGEKAFSGLARYQTVTWVKKAALPDRTVWHKCVKYDNIKMSYGVVVPVGDNTTEEWIIVNENNVSKVASVRRLA